MSVLERIRPSTVGASPTEPRRHPQIHPIHLMVIVVVLVAAGGFTGLTKLLGSGVSTATVELESISSVGSNPFMIAAGSDLPVAPASDAATKASGSSAGLHGAIRKTPSCDVRAMVAYLTANAAKAAAWAGNVKIEVSSIPAYVATLTPALLRADTYVTNIGFAAGPAQGTVSVLQAGTAVLIDRFGTPRVKCYSGNPLTEASAPAQPKFAGNPWRGFDEAKITVIRPSPTPLDDFTMINPVNGEVIRRPVGTSGASDRLITPGQPDQEADEPPAADSKPTPRINPAPRPVPAPAPNAGPAPPTTTERQGLLPPLGI